jgi:hypothetical protein
VQAVWTRRLFSQTCIQYYLWNFQWNGNILHFFWGGNSPTFEFYAPTFRNTLCSSEHSVFYLHRQVDVDLHLPAYEDGTECSETSTYKIQTPGNYPEESIKHSKHGESLKSRNGVILIIVAYEWCWPLEFNFFNYTVWKYDTNLVFMSLNVSHRSA